MIEFVRTPDARFAGLPDYPFRPHYVEVDGLRMHYVDEGPAEAPPVLLLHGEPSWSFLYRHMIVGFARLGHRVVAPDLIGFGKSDKPIAQSDYTVARHVRWLRRLVEALDLRHITLFGQDWGSSLGLRVVAELHDRFDRIVIGNGLLPAEHGVETKRWLIRVWQAMTRWSPWLPVGRIVQSAAGHRLSKDEVRAYDAPFPDERFLAGVRVFPQIIPMSASDPATPANVEAWNVLRGWNKPFLTIYSEGEPVLQGMDTLFQERIPGAQGQPHGRVPGGHFLQEASGLELVRRIHAWMRADASAA